MSTKTARLEVPAAILLSWNTGSGTLEDIAKTAYISGSLRFAYGITEQQYAGTSLHRASALPPTWSR